MAAPGVDRPQVLPGGRQPEPSDPRVQAVLEVLAGEPVGVVAEHWELDAALVHRWVRAFVEAGTAQVTHRPVGDVARERDRFLGAFMHGLRSPLATAQGWIALLRDQTSHDAMAGEAVSRLQEQLDLLDEQALDVELLTAAMLGRLSLDRRVVRVADLVAGLPALPDRTGHPTRLSGPTGPVGVVGGIGPVGGEGPGLTVTVDPLLFGRVLRDLWSAAISAHPPARRVRLSTATIGPWAEIRVDREGDPVDPARLHALFEPFDTPAELNGATLGLYLARALTVVHGGTVGVEQDDGHTRFWVRVATDATAPAPGPDAEPPTDHPADDTDPPSAEAAGPDAPDEERGHP